MINIFNKTWFPMKIYPLIVFLSLRLYTKFSYLVTKTRLNNKINKLIRSKGLKKLTKEEKKEIQSYYKTQNKDRISFKWHRFYSKCNDVFLADYVPEDLFYQKLEPFFNKRDFGVPFMDKNFLTRILPNIKQPETIINNINGFYFHKGELIDFERAVSICKKEIGFMVIKPSLDSGGGKNVRLFSGAGKNCDNVGASIDNLFKNYNKDFLVQKVVEQHPKLSSLNPTSLNTFRVMSFFSETGVEVLSTIIRMGGENSFTDNGTTGGVSCGVGENGKLNKYGYKLSGERFTATHSGVVFEGYSLPSVEKMLDVVKTAHKQLPYFKVISWDCAIGAEKEIVLIEFNTNGQGINSHQLNNGAVLSKLVKSYAKQKG
ncbi:sugar-transfer associated ATP-grasp domain-containing protein [Zobellia russellii]|uniref:sugar-transfer associated ATP-grasp domain-containing protein n=1 Tax=Zobellia russellii TaxID=248907 RepID=UPI001BFEED80|nr:sugar-transfer associated ATP-grasp domain-containing protein [Zobellia russellii]MBT9189031.1 hypothetical protein [Zobellia russellii]